MEKIHKKTKHVKKINSGLIPKLFATAKKNGGFRCINIKDIFSGLKLSWIRRYALNKINDHWCDIIDKECGIEDPKDRQKILGWGSEFFIEPIQKSYPGISDFLTALRTLNKNWVTPREKMTIGGYTNHFFTTAE